MRLPRSSKRLKVFRWAPPSGVTWELRGRFLGGFMLSERFQVDFASRNHRKIVGFYRKSIRNHSILNVSRNFVISLNFYKHDASNWRLLEAAWRHVFVFWRRFEDLWRGLRTA